MVLVTLLRVLYAHPAGSLDELVGLGWVPGDSLLLLLLLNEFGIMYLSIYIYMYI